MSGTVVRNFARYTRQQLSRLKNELSLSMSDEMLVYCMEHYKNTEHRDPFTDELQALSALSEESEQLPKAACIYDFSTPDRAIAETYADAVRKRKIHNPRATYPPTLEELSHLATRELSRVGKALPPCPRLRMQYTPDVLLSDHAATLALQDGHVRLEALFAQNPSPTVGDILILLSDMPTEDGEAFSPVPIKRSSRLMRVGVLCELINFYEGANVDLTPFSVGDGLDPLKTLTGSSYRGFYLLCVSASDVSELLSHIKKRNIYGVPFARLTDTGRISFTQQGRPSFGIQTEFLRTLFRRKKFTFSVSDEDASLSAIERFPITHATCSYLDSAASQKGEEIAFLDGICCAAASATLSSTAFRSALYTALAPILTMVSHGIPLADQSLSAVLAYASERDCLASLLALYRVQTELSVPARTCTLIPGESAEPLHLSVFSLAEQKRGAAHAHSPETSSVYCLMLPVKEDGIPDFSELRKSLTLLSDLSAKGLISEAHLLINESAQEGLRRMERMNTFSPEESDISLTEPLPLAMLIASPASLPLSLIGTSVVKASMAHEIPASVPDFKASLIPATRPEIVLLASNEDENATSLASLLSLRGAHVRRFSDDEASTLPLARALLGAHALILCPGAVLREDAHLLFAKETLLRAKGAILALYTCDVPDVLSLPDGIPDEILEALLTIS